MSLTSNRSNVRTNLKIDPKEKIWSNDTLDRFINEGQRWVINDPALEWQFAQTTGYLVPVLDYQEYRSSSDDNPETYFSTKVRKLIHAKSSNGTNLQLGDGYEYTNSSATAPSILSEYAQRFFLNAGYQTAATYTTLHNCDTYNGDGTWAGTNDATTVATDGTTYKAGAGSVSFSVDVSNSTSNKATLTNPDMTSVDASAPVLNDSAIIMWVYLTDATDIRSIELKFGSSSANYYAVKTYATDVQGQAYADGWNRIFIPTLNRQTTGSPDMSAVDYLQANITFDSGEADQASCRIDNIQIVDKYLSYKYIASATDLSGDSAESVIPSLYQYVYELYAEYKALRIIGGREQQATMKLDEARLAKNLMIEEIMYNIPRSYQLPPK